MILHRSGLLTPLIHRAAYLARGGASGRRAFSILLVILPVIALLGRCILIQHTFGGSAETISELSFGFGGYVRGLLEDGEFRSCTPAPFPECAVDQCQYATRMPAAPLLYAGLAQFVGEKSFAVAIAKCVLMALLLSTILAVFVKDFAPSAIGVLLLYVLYLGPQALKHGSAIVYEEGLVLDLQFGLAFALAYFLIPAAAAISRTRLVLMGSIAVAIAVLMYFTKTSTLPVLIVVLAIVLTSIRVGRAFKALALAGVAIPLIAWGTHVFTTTHTWSVSSSWNGENLYRGFNDDSVAVYPGVLLDRLFDSKHVTLENGRDVALGTLAASPACFADEWAWSRFYAERAKQWAREHPLETFRFLGRKLWVTLLELRHTPYRIAATGPNDEYPRLVTLAMTAWMIVGRGAFFVLVACLIFEVFARRRLVALWSLALLAAALAPYVAVFSYQRHVVPILLLSAGLLATQYLARPRHDGTVIS